MSYVVAVDSGGTFTDCVVRDVSGTITRAKAPSTPPDFEQGVIASVSEAASGLGLSLDELLAKTTIFAHGTTVATNVLITRTGAKTALLTTRGHEDAIVIGRTAQKVAGLSESEIIDTARLSKADPLVPRSRIFGVDERVDRSGTVVVPLYLDALDDLAERLHAEGVESVAISLLWSFLNPEHERALRTWLETAGRTNGGASWFVSTSSELVPVVREYERTSTTVLNAYLTPSVSGYLERMRSELRAHAHDGAVAVMHSSGGVCSVDEAKTRGVSLLSSGPAGGMLGARALAEQLGFERAVATDVGGTSFDVGVVVDGEVSYARAPVFAKYPVALPVVDVTSVGAGGGSIAWVEPETGVLRVGPRSAGARPGPACYGAGGTEPTVTDADLVLGRLDPDYFLGGRMRIDAEKALAALETVARPLAMEPDEAAAAVVEIVDAHMADLIRKVTVERGLDPALFPLLAYGGAGGLHAGSYASKLGSRHVVVPPAAAVFSAFGIGASDAKRVAIASDPMRAPFDLVRWRERLEQLEARLRRELEEERLPTENLTLTRYVDLQFTGQVHAVRIAVDHDDLAADDGGERVVARFTELYEGRYGPGTAYRQAGVEALTFSVEAIAGLPIPRLEPLSSEGSDVSDAQRGERSVYLHERGRFEDVPVLEAEKLRPGNELQGPAVVEAPDTTVLVHEGQRLWVDGFLNFRLDLGVEA
jgi:N-methylhydantoinase A